MVKRCVGKVCSFFIPPPIHFFLLPPNAKHLTCILLEPPDPLQNRKHAPTGVLQGINKKTTPASAAHSLVSSIPSDKRLFKTSK